MDTQTITIEMKPKGLAMETNREDFALALKTWRLRKNMTQQQVAERWGVSRYTILRAERAKAVSWTIAYKLFGHLAEELRKESLPTL